MRLHHPEPCDNVKIQRAPYAMCHCGSMDPLRTERLLSTSMLGIKRRRSRSTDKPKKPKKLTDDRDGEEDLDSILEKIRQQEESEALARKLQEEFDQPPNDRVRHLTESIGETSQGHTKSPTIEDDEALARSLAHKWNQLDDSEPLSSTLEKTEYVSQFSNAMHGGLDPPMFASQPAESFRSASGFLTLVTDPAQDLLRYRELFTQSRSCTKCKKSVASPRSQVVFSSTIPSPTLLALLHATCSACEQSHCRGCFRARTCAKSCKGNHCDVSSCCAEVRAIALFETLGGFDKQYIVEQAHHVSQGERAPSQNKVATVGPGGTGYSATSDEHPGHGSGSRGQSESRKITNAREAIAARWDDIILRALNTIIYFLPSPYADHAASFDLLPHPSIQSLISLSYLPELLGGLLINDSVSDWMARNDVYNSLLKLLRRMADSELSIRVLVGERWEKKKSVGIDNWMWGDGEIEWEMNASTNEIVRAPPLYDHFRTLAKQCQTFLAGASHLLFVEDGDSEVEDMTVRATSLCGDMLSAQQDMQRALSALMHLESPEKSSDQQGKGKGKDKDVSVDMEKEYRVACEDLAFMHIPLSCESRDGGRDYPGYHFARLVVETETSTRLPAKRFHLIKEISATSTSLPPGVWVRVDEVRNDVLKIMIAGPEGTPYAGGLFEFDCFLPLDFPDSPPLVNLATTGGGTVRFNPNLYENGKVCLSLLGTWPGRPEEQWSPKSSLLQVLVSIQSMILVEAPYFNEPGMGKVDSVNTESLAYNRNISLQTVHWAMIEWMKDEHRNGIWKDVIATHFSIRRSKIRDCIHTWAKSDPYFLNYGANSTKQRKSRKPTHSGPGNLNLLDEFDRGCTLVEGWIEKNS